MESLHFENAQVAYEKGDFVEALKEYYACLKEDHAAFGPGDAGLVYYRLGNCLLKMRSFQEACTTYTKALEDNAYSDKASVRVNLGKSQIGLGEYEAAVTSFNAALADPTYRKPYQAQMGLGTAFSRLGMIIDAGTAFRNAALDERNPNPTKALVQLGACFRSLGRPQDAIESYKAVFDFNPTGITRSKVYESLGQTYTDCGQYLEAVEAFTAAVAEGRYALSNDALTDYQKALAAIAPTITAPAASADEYDAVGAAPMGVASYQPEQPFQDDSEGYGAGNVPLANDTGFFTATEDDLIEIGKKQMRKERKLRHMGLKVLLVVMIILVLALGSAVYLFWQGYGYPSQETVITEMFAEHANGNDVLSYWVVTDDNEAVILQKMNMVAKADHIELTYLDSQMAKSEAVVTAHLKEGGVLKYEVILDRDLISWKIADITLVFDSQRAP